MIPLVSMRSRQNLNVFISSPSDIVTEREAARDVVRTVNDGVARRLGFTLTYKGWDVMHPRDMTPEQWMKLQLRDCDFFLMILWRRYGTPPSETSSCGSGTVREFEIALDLRERENRPEIAVYFGSIEKHLREDPGEQLKQVLAFRERLEQKHKPLYKEYCSTEGFRDEFRANLTDWLLTLWESRPDEKQQILQRFFALGAPPDQKPEAQIVYPLLEEKQTDITHLLPYMVLEDFQAMHKVTKCLNSIGHAQVHTIMDELYRDPNAGHRAARWNKIFLCSRNLSGQRYLDRIRHSGLDCQFEVHHPHPGEPNERSIKWTNKHGSILVRSPQADYLHWQRDYRPEWRKDPGKCVAVDFAVLARFPDANAAANHALGDLKAFFIMGIRGLGTWGAAWYLDWRSMDLANRLPPKEDVTYQALLKVEYWDYRVREVTDVSEENQAFFDREMAPETIQKTLEEHCVRYKKLAHSGGRTTRGAEGRRDG